MVLARLTQKWVRQSLDYLPRRPVSLGTGLLIAAACVAGATLLRVAMEPVVAGGVPFVTLFPAVLVASVWGGTLAGISVLLIGSLIAAYLWLPHVQGIQLAGGSWYALVAFWVMGAVLIVTAGLLRALIDAVVQSEQRAAVLAHEMKHRVNNVLGVVQAMERQSARGAGTVDEYRAKLEGRIAAFGLAQDIVAHQPGLPDNLAALLGRILEPFGGDHFALSGPKIAVPTDVGSSLALLLHELGTNATKYGALSAPNGRVAIDWAFDRDEVNMVWREIDGPAVAEPSQNGFGSRLMKTAFPPGRGEVRADFEADGLRCTICFPTTAALT